VSDPYRWLEEIDSEETEVWIEAQNELTRRYLRELPARRRIRARVEELWSYEQHGIPVSRGGRYFFSRHDGVRNQRVLYWQQSLEEEPRVLLDVNDLSQEGDVALRTWVPSESGRLIAYGLSSRGSDWQELRVREVDTGRDRADRLEWVKFSHATWTHDNKGFFYNRYDAPPEGREYRETNYHQKVYYHRLGTPQSEDRLIYERPDHKDWTFSANVTEDGRYLILTVGKGALRKNRILVKELTPDGGEIVELIGEFEAQFGFVGSEGRLLYFKTDLDSPLSRVLEIDLDRPEPSSWREIIPEASEGLRKVTFVGNRFIGVYLKHAQSKVKIFDRQGTALRELELPGIGTALGFRGRRGDRQTFYRFTSYTAPPTIYRYDLEGNRSTVFRRPEVDFDPSEFRTDQVFYSSRDGTTVPMFVTRRKDLALDGRNPTYLHGYGGFGAAVTPRFSPMNIVWMEMGGVVAQPNLRGGGEYGTSWHERGKKLVKQNTFDDFIAAAEWLIENRFTNKRRLAIGGGSNGGLLVGAVMIQRPDLFAGALPLVGLFDMLRFHQFTIGWAWQAEYGSPDDASEFQVLLAYSPYHNTRAGMRYPATLIMTGDHDDRVYPAHSYKFAAALQHAQRGGAPILLRVERNTGHGAGKPMRKRIDAATDALAFMASALGVEVD
jgi:prolyl oligopeptidase